jgi:hypothetical protein
LNRGTNRPTASDQKCQSITHGVIKRNDADREKRSNSGKEGSGRTEDLSRIGAGVPFFRDSSTSKPPPEEGRRGSRWMV